MFPGGHERAGKGDTECGIRVGFVLVGAKVQGSTSIGASSVRPDLDNLTFCDRDGPLRVPLTVPLTTIPGLFWLPQISTVDDAGSQRGNIPPCYKGGGERLVPVVLQ